MRLPEPIPAPTPTEILALAAAYHSAAEDLIEKGRPREPISRAPARLCAIHAIELYLNAFLLSSGDPPEKVRAHFHNLADRANTAVARGLILRKRTLAHLVRMTEEREYLISRYAPELSASLSQGNRLMASLDEIARKVGQKVMTNEPAARPRTASKKPSQGEGTGQAHDGEHRAHLQGLPQRRVQPEDGDDQGLHDDREAVADRHIGDCFEQ